jgi:hypothetical protein
LFGRLFPGKRTTYLFQIFWIILIQIIEKPCLKNQEKLAKIKKKQKEVNNIKKRHYIYQCNHEKSQEQVSPYKYRYNSNLKPNLTNAKVLSDNY